jgi:O-antigen/teichoic acid export membrane protein
VFVLGILAAPVVLALFGGAKAVGGTAAFQVLEVATYFAVVQVAVVNALSSGTQRQVRIPVVSTVIGCVVGLALVVPVGREFGAAGLSAAYLIAVVIGASGPIVVVWRSYRMNWLLPVLRSLVVLIGALVLGLVLAAWTDGRPGRILIDLVVGILAAGVAALILRSDIRSIVREARPKRRVDTNPVGTLVP